MTTTHTFNGPVRIADASELRTRVRGAILTPEEPGWDDARGTFNTLLDQRPALIALPEDAHDVRAIVAFAGENDLQVVPQRTGHNAEPLGSIEGTILLRTDRMRQVEIDPERRRALVGAGAKWEDLVPQASVLGLAALHGSTPDVSIAGYAMGGGVGWYGRKLGLAADSVTGFEVVTADGQMRWVNAEYEPDLFWAMRGGGGNFGAVTSLEIRLFDMPELYAGVLFFPWERSAEVLHAWHAWTKTVPEETTSVARIIQFPPTPDVPAALRGGSFAIVEAFHIGGETEGADILRPLRELGPVLDTFAMIPPVGLSEIHMDPTEPLPYATDHLVLGELSAGAIDALVSAVGPGSGSPLISVEIRHLGGAMSRPSSSPGALATLPGEYLLFGVGVTPDEPAEGAVRSALEAMLASVRPHASGLYFNFAEQRIDPARLFGEDTYRRLQAVKRAIDPHGRFRANHAIAPEADVVELDRHRPPAHVITNSLTIAIDASVRDTRRAIAVLDLAAPALRALGELGLRDHVTVRAGGLSWQQDGATGTIEVDVDLRVEPGAAEDAAWLSIKTSFSATEERARVRLLDAWGLIGPLASTLADGAARTVKRYAERDDLEDDAFTTAGLRAA